MRCRWHCAAHSADSSAGAAAYLKLAVLLQSMTVHKSRLEKAKEEAVAARKAEQALLYTT